MSSRQLLLLSGQVGSGTSAIARASAARSGARAITTDHASGFSSDALRTLLDGFEPAIVDAMSAHSPLGCVDALLCVDQALRSGESVIWDAGPIERLLTDLAALDALPALEDQISTPMLGLLGGSLVAPERLRQLQEVRDLIGTAMIRLREPTTFVVIVDEPTHGLRKRTRSVRARLELLSLTLDRLIVNRVPRSKDSWPKAWAKQRRQEAASVAGLGLTVTPVPWFASDMEHRLRRKLPPLDGSTQRRPESPVLERLGEEFTYRIHLSHARPARVRVGRRADTLVIEVEALRRYLALPSVLARCILDGGGFIGTDLVLRFTPDPAKWRGAA